MATYGNTALDPVAENCGRCTPVPTWGNTTASNWPDVKTSAPRIDQQRFAQASAVA